MDKTTEDLLAPLKKTLDEHRKLVEALEERCQEFDELVAAFIKEHNL